MLIVALCFTSVVLGIQNRAASAERSKMFSKGKIICKGEEPIKDIWDILWLDCGLWVGEDDLFVGSQRK